MINRKLIGALGLALVVLLGFGCSLSVNDPVRSIPIIEPYISVQPQSYSYYVDEFTGPPTLSVGMYDWMSEDGRISYQWYTFDSIEQYCAPPRGGRAIGGATSSTYTPSGITPGGDKRYYYYVIITNNFPDGTDRTTASIQSELSIISFATADTAPFPVITRQPLNASYTIGRAASIAPLDVRAVPPTKTEIVEDKPVTTLNGTISYQWYSNTTFSAEDGTLITGATQPTLIPDVSGLARGENYFYVEVTNAVRVGIGSQARTVTSTLALLPVIINMLPGEKAEAPRIERQPRDQLVFTGNDPLPLSVEAVPLDGGTLSYQWFSADKAAATRTDPVRGTEISGETAETYTPDITVVRSYYYVEVTNTNANVTDPTPAMLRSKVVTVTVADSGDMTANATITIPNNYNVPGSASRFQYIRGYGGMDVAWMNFPGQYESDTHTMYNPDWGLGFNILRIMIMPPGSNDPNFTSHDVIIDGLITKTDGLGVRTKRDYINNVKIVNGYGGYVLASPWTPPKEWKTNNSVNSGGHLIPQYYKNFANYLKAYCQYMYYQGAPVYAVSIANEPNYAGGYDGCEWSPEQMRDFWLEVGHFTDGVRGYGGGQAQPFVRTVNGESANHPNINNAALNNAASRAAIDFYCRHVYASQTNTLWENPNASWREGSGVQTECWMTEHNINSATPNAYPNDYTWNYVWRFMNDVDLVLRLNNENAFVWWANKRFYSYIGEGSYGNVEGNILPRGQGLSHFAKYTIDTTRINFTMTGTLRNGTAIGPLDRPPDQNGKVNVTRFGLDTTDAKITAYVSQDGNEISMVMYTPTLTDGSGGVDLGTIRINMPEGFEIGSAKAQRSTSATSMMVLEDVSISSDRKSAYVNLPPGHLLSVKFTRK